MIWMICMMMIMIESNNKKHQQQKCWFIQTLKSLNFKCHLLCCCWMIFSFDFFWFWSIKKNKQTNWQTMYEIQLMMMRKHYGFYQSDRSHQSHPMDLIIWWLIIIVIWFAWFYNWLNWPKFKFPKLYQA